MDGIYNKDERKDTDIIRDIVHHAVDTSYDAIPVAVIESTKRFILDTLGTALAGSTADGCQRLVKHMSGMGDKKEATVWGFGRKVSAESAAFLNGVMGHARDFDDTHDVAVIHTHTSVLPATIAAAEKTGRSGKDILAAVSIGVEFFCRIGLASPNLNGWVHSSTIAYLASALAVCKVLGFDERRCLNALGIAYSQMAGNLLCLEERTLAKRIQPGLGARAGVYSAILADAGITGPHDVLEGKYGYFNQYQNGDYDRSVIAEDLEGFSKGTTLISMKPWPSCRGTHAAVDLALNCVSVKNINYQLIEYIKFYVPQIVFDLTGKRFEVGDDPQVSAQFSIPYTVATAIMNRGLFLKDFEAENIINSPALGLAKRIVVCVDQDINPDALSPVKMELKLADGTVIQDRVQSIKGSPDNPMTWTECIEKFKECTKYSIKPALMGNVEKVAEIVLNLEKVNDISTLLENIT